MAPFGALFEGVTRAFLGADDGIRTRDPHLGKVMLYQLSHVRKLLPTLSDLSGRPGIPPHLASVSMHSIYGCAAPRFAISTPTEVLGQVCPGGYEGITDTTFAAAFVELHETGVAL